MGMKEFGSEIVDITDEPPLDYIYSHKVLIGHNIKFDLHFLRMLDEDRFTDWLANGGTVYDTQIVEYMLSGQSMIYPELDVLSAKYGGTLKDERVTAMFKAGMSAADVPDELLVPYQKADVMNTELVYIWQREQANEQFWRLVKVQMDFLLFLQTCEFNGMAVDEAANERIINELREQIQQLNHDIRYIAGFDLNPDSPRHLAAWVYGGTVVVRSRVPVGVYKTGARKGQEKMGWVEETIRCKGITRKRPKKTPAGNIITDEATLKQFESDVVIGKLMETKKLSKRLSTYHLKIQECAIEGIVHGNLNQCATVTGRISSNDPNMQNIPRSEH